MKVNPILVGRECRDQSREVGIFYGNVSLTPHDQSVYLPQFIHSLRIELDEILNNRINPDGFILDLGPTTDDCSARIELIGADAKLSFEVNAGEVIVTTLPPTYLVKIYQRVIKIFGCFKI